MHARDADVVIVGGGPVGLTLAARLGQWGVRVVVVEADERGHGEGSKALCMQRETLESWARIGVGDAVARRGVSWNVGRTYFRTKELFARHLPHDGDDHFPAFVNISQTDVEHLLITAAEALPAVAVRWQTEAVALSQQDAGVTVEVRDRGGHEAAIRARYAVGTDGVRSAVRRFIGVDFPGHSFDDLFLIADIRAELPFPDERRFFFDPPFNPGRQVLIHPQPDSVWRIDWQVPGDTDVEAERRSGRLDERIRAVVGSASYELVWLTAYRFHQRVADRFRAGNVLLAGDAAHVMSPFGARGLNSGVADVENLAWRLRAALACEAAGGLVPEQVLDTYHEERRAAAVENLRVTGETMRFMVPRPGLDRLRRNTILRASTRVARLRAMVNSGRLAEPFVYPPATPGPGRLRVGGVVPDIAAAAPTGAATGADRPAPARLKEVVGASFAVLTDRPLEVPEGVRNVVIAPDPAGGEESGGRVTLVAAAPCIAERFGFPFAGGQAVVVRPDGHVAALVEATPEAVRAVLAAVTGGATMGA